MRVLLELLEVELRWLCVPRDEEVDSELDREVRLLLY